MLISRFVIHEAETIARRLALYKNKGIHFEEVIRARKLDRYISMKRYSRDVIIWRRRAQRTNSTNNNNNNSRHSTSLKRQKLIHHQQDKSKNVHSRDSSASSLFSSSSSSSCTDNFCKMSIISSSHASLNQHYQHSNTNHVSSAPQQQQQHHGQQENHKNPTEVSFMDFSTPIRVRRNDNHFLTALLHSSSISSNNTDSNSIDTNFTHSYKLTMFPEDENEEVMDFEDKLLNTDIKNDQVWNKNRKRISHSLALLKLTESWLDSQQDFKQFLPNGIQDHHIMVISDAQERNDDNSDESQIKAVLIYTPSIDSATITTKGINLNSVATTSPLTESNDLPQINFLKLTETPTLDLDVVILKEFHQIYPSFIIHNNLMTENTIIKLEKEGFGITASSSSQYLKIHRLSYSFIPSNTSFVNSDNENNNTDNNNSQQTTLTVNTNNPAHSLQYYLSPPITPMNSQSNLLNNSKSVSQYAQHLNSPSSSNGTWIPEATFEASCLLSTPYGNSNQELLPQNMNGQNNNNDGSPVSNFLQKRFSSFVRQKHPLNLSFAERNNRKVSRYLNEVKAVRNQFQNLRRGYWACGVGNTKFNLGNELHISENFDNRLTRDKNQFVIDLSESHVECQGVNGNLQISFVTINGPTALKKSADLQALFDEANVMMEKTFIEKGIQADLNMVLDKSFLAELAICQNQVIGAVLFVFTQKYVWIEDLVVHPSFQKMGVGTALVNRMQKIAGFRKKDILLYAIESALNFYKVLGFVITDRYLIKYKIFKGQYLEWIS